MARLGIEVIAFDSSEVALRTARSRFTDSGLPILFNMTSKCPDCECSIGELHEMFCTKERCPFCLSQLVSCSCISTVLNLSTEEQRAVDEYIDDEIEPLKGINERWVRALNKKGRVPFQ